MRVTLLGTGDATGTPKIGCECTQCRGARERGEERLRTSILVSTGTHNVLIDTSPDLRRQLLAAGSPRIDAVIWTHGHYDHFMGYGEFYRVQPFPDVYAAPDVLAYCGGIFGFLSFTHHPALPFSPFHLYGLEFTLVTVNHPPVPCYGVVVREGGVKVGYTSDTRQDICRESQDALSSSDLLLLDALMPPQYRISKHMNLKEATTLATTLSPGEYRFIHMSHHIPWTTPHAGLDGESFCWEQ